MKLSTDVAPSIFDLWTLINQSTFWSKNFCWQAEYDSSMNCKIVDHVVFFTASNSVNQAKSKYFIVRRKKIWMSGSEFVTYEDISNGRSYYLLCIPNMSGLRMGCLPWIWVTYIFAILGDLFFYQILEGFFWLWKSAIWHHCPLQILDCPCKKNKLGSYKI